MKENTNDLIEDYAERHRFWTDKVISQFASTTNLFFILSAGFLAYLASQENMENLFKIDFDLAFDISKMFFALAAISALMSVIFSCVTELSRLHDLRLTRHTLWIRKKSYQKWKKSFPDDYVDFPTKSLSLEIKYFITTLKHRKYFITDKDIENQEKLKVKFDQLRKRNLMLVRFSWRCLNYQILLLTISLILFAISIWI